ncbi:LLM class flavin-dependent oxidoreductase [Nocardia asteroides]|uniref:LLM class flavin-dependent oxidoreductase n=1 Tax=Nocardia asteroides TaxID=1824 RepID=UPI001E3FAD34|nr:LLM class flavin-dependent oxidoreductase [Nocardia asteroides]UGT55572.1 LLM class flavin-dependent oxidoreductase [Nocardia asteroides]
MGDRDFGVLVLPDASAPEMLARFRRVEEFGFDQLFLPDHMANVFATQPAWLDGATMAAAAVLSTERIRIGTLVSNPVLRAPALLAKEALTLDHLSGGRFELGIGAGIVPADHHATGTEPWSVRERVARFAEYVRVLDEILSAGGERYTFDGEWYRVRDLATGPAAVRRPRPPIVVGGQAPSILRVAAERADVWNTNGKPELSLDENIALAARQNRELDELCERNGRDPRALRRSALLWATTDPLTGPAGLEELVERLSGAGIEDFVLGWPEPAQTDRFEALVREVIPKLR